MTRLPVSNSDAGDVGEVGETLARYYDLDVADERADIAMYLALASASDGPILEVACGSGRISVPLAAAGHNVTGVDIDRHMLARAGTAWSDGQATARGSLHLIRADMTTLQLEQRFDLVILGFNSILLLPNRDAQQRIVETMRDHLTPDGRVVIDVWQPAPEDLALYDGRHIEEWLKHDAQTNGLVSKGTSAHYDPGSRHATVVTVFESKSEGQPPTRVNRRDEIRFVAAAELLEMIDQAGLQPQMIVGDYAMSDYEPTSERLIVVAAGQPSRLGLL